MAKAAIEGSTGTGICKAHGFIPLPVTILFQSGFGSPNVRDGNAGNAGLIRIGDVCIASCGHTGVALVGSSIGKADGIFIHRIGDTGSLPNGGSFTTTTGSSVIELAG